MKNRTPLIVAGIVVVALLAFVVYRVSRPQPQVTQAPPVGSTVAPPPNEDADETARKNVPRIEPAELAAEWKAGSATIIDVRDADAFAQAHIPGARHVPLAQVEATAPYLPKSKPIVAYCT